MPRVVPISRFRFADHVRPRETLAWPQGTGEPLTLTAALVAQRHDLVSPELFIGMGLSPTLRPEHADVFRIVSLNGAGSNRHLTAAGAADILPVPVSTVPGLLRSGRRRADIALIVVRPHTRAGYYSAGTMADYVQALASSARLVIAEVNENLPLTEQDALIPAADIDILVESSGRVLELADPEPGDIDIRVAGHVAGLIPDRATVQFGIGGLPIAVARALKHHKGLGVHSGVIPDGVVDLVEAGVITNAHKGVDAGASVTGGLFGTRRLYDYADGERRLHMRSVEHTHNVRVMAGLHAFHAVNSAIEVDLGGQVNAEVAAGRYLGAVGGQPDFVRGALASEGGRSIIALPSTTPDGKRSRIVARLDGVPVTTPRSDADCVVTEYGVAELRGQPLSERARRLIAIAHPAFREELERAGGPGMPARAAEAAA